MHLLQPGGATASRSQRAVADPQSQNAHLSEMYKKGRRDEPQPAGGGLLTSKQQIGLHSGQKWLQGRCPVLKGVWAKQHWTLVKLGAEVRLLQQQLVAYISDLIFQICWTSNSSHGLQLGLLAAQQFWKSDNFSGCLNMDLGMLALATPTYKFWSCYFCNRGNPN